MLTAILETHYVSLFPNIGSCKDVDSIKSDRITSQFSQLMIQFISPFHCVTSRMETQQLSPTKPKISDSLLPISIIHDVSYIYLNHCIRLYLVVPVNKFSFLLKDLQKEGRKIDVREKCNDVNTNKYLIIIIHKWAFYKPTARKWYIW